MRLNERRRCGSTSGGGAVQTPCSCGFRSGIHTLEQDGTYYCFMDDFCTGNIKTFKNAMFVSALKDKMGKALTVDTHALIDEIIRNLRMDVSAAEKSNFYNKYIRKMRLEIDEKGILRIKVQEE